MDSLAAGTTAQAERGNGDTMCSRAQCGVTHTRHIPNGFGTSSNMDTKQQQTSGAEAGVAVRTMRLQGGARSSQRGGSINGETREKHLFWEECGWLFCCAVSPSRRTVLAVRGTRKHQPWVVPYPLHGAWGDEGPVAVTPRSQRHQLCWEMLHLRVPDECPFLRRGRRVGWAHVRKNFQFRNEQRQFLLLLVECQHLWSQAPLSTNTLTNAPLASAKIKIPPPHFFQRKRLELSIHYTHNKPSFFFLNPVLSM